MGERSAEHPSMIHPSMTSIHGPGPRTSSSQFGRSANQRLAPASPHLFALRFPCLALLCSTSVCNVPGTGVSLSVSSFPPPSLCLSLSLAFSLFWSCAASPAGPGHGSSQLRDTRARCRSSLYLLGVFTVPAQPLPCPMPCLLAGRRQWTWLRGAM